MTRCSSRRLAAGAAALAAAVACMVGAGGCRRGSDLPLAPVRGVVTHQGKPLSHGEVVFTPMEGTPGPQAVGRIEPNGAFRMQTGSHWGAAVGRHRVTVHCRERPTEEQRHDMLFIPPSLIPEAYSNPDTSPFQVDVEPKGNHVPLELE